MEDCIGDFGDTAVDWSEWVYASGFRYRIEDVDSISIYSFRGVYKLDYLEY